MYCTLPPSYMAISYPPWNRGAVCLCTYMDTGIAPHPHPLGTEGQYAYVCTWIRASHPTPIPWEQRGSMPMYVHGYGHCTPPPSPGNRGAVCLCMYMDTGIAPHPHPLGTEGQYAYVCTWIRASHPTPIPWELRGMQYIYAHGHRHPPPHPPGNLGTICLRKYIDTGTPTTPHPLGTEVQYTYAHGQRHSHPTPMGTEGQYVYVHT